MRVDLPPEAYNDFAKALATTGQFEAFETIALGLIRDERVACAALLDKRAQEYNRQRDPGMANHCRQLARAIRART